MRSRYAAMKRATVPRPDRRAWIESGDVAAGEASVEEELGLAADQGRERGRAGFEIGQREAAGGVVVEGEGLLDGGEDALLRGIAGLRGHGAARTEEAVLGGGGAHLGSGRARGLLARGDDVEDVGEDVEITLRRR
ncbi:MAG: hypothetical protein QM820_25600 [Minicystis sp.]